MTHPMYALGSTYIANTTIFSVLFLSSHYSLLMLIVVFQLLSMAFYIYIVRPSTLEMKMCEMRQSLVFPFLPTLQKEIHVKI